MLVADEREEDEDGESLGKVKMGESKMNDNQEDQLKALLSELGDVITEKLSHTYVKGVVCTNGASEKTNDIVA